MRVRRRERLLHSCCRWNTGHRRCCPAIHTLLTSRYHRDGGTCAPETRGTGDSLHNYCSVLELNKLFDFREWRCVFLCLSSTLWQKSCMIRLRKLVADVRHVGVHTRVVALVLRMFTQICCTVLHCYGLRHIQSNYLCFIEYIFIVRLNVWDVKKRLNTLPN